MKYPANLSHPGAKATLISVGAVVSVAAPAQATWYYSDSVTNQTVTLDSSGDKWYTQGGSIGNSLLSAFVTGNASSCTFYLDCSIAAVSFNFAHTTSTPRSYITNYTASSSNVIFNGTSPVITIGISDSQYYLTEGTDSTLATRDFKNFTSGTTGYVVFSFVLSSATYYGWASITVNTTGANSITINEWAYTSNESIYVGQTSSGTPAIPEPAETAGGLGLLALGAAGMSRYLRNRKKTAA